MIPTEGRIRVLTYLSRPGAYAFPNGIIPACFHDRQGRYAITSDMLGMFERAGFIERGKPPKKSGFVSVWMITEAGSEYLSKFKDRAVSPKAVDR